MESHYIVSVKSADRYRYGSPIKGKRMESMLIVWLFYATSFGKYGYSTLELEQFETSAKCEEAAKSVREVINLRGIPRDQFTISCVDIKK